MMCKGNMLIVVALCIGAKSVLAAEPTGGELFAHYCSYCHGAEDGPGTVQLGRTRGADRAFLTKRKDLAQDYIQYVVRHGLKAMPPFAPSDLDDKKLKALSAFLALGASQ